MAKRIERYLRMKKSMKKVKRKTPTGQNILVYRKKRRGAAVCSNCGRELHGIPRARDAEMRKLAASERRPNRKFGGCYCADCSREIFKEKARKV